MVRRVVVTGAFDLLALVFLYFVLQDLAWRTSYAESERLVPHTTYSFFVREFSIAGNVIQVHQGLVSPPTLDWVQLVVALLVVVNGLYAFSALRKSTSRTR